MLGSFLISHAVALGPTQQQLMLLQRPGHLAGLVSQQERTLAAQRRLEQEDQKRQRLESLGVLTGGIAHDFNNLVTSVLGNLALADQHAESDVVRGYIAAAEDACEQSKVLTGRFLAFAKGAQPVREAVDLGALVDDCTSLSLSRCDVRLERSFVVPKY